MYIAVATDQEGKVINPDFSSLERWKFESDLIGEIVNLGYAEIGDTGVYESRDGESFAKIVKVEG